MSIDRCTERICDNAILIQQLNFSVQTIYERLEALRWLSALPDFATCSILTAASQELR